MRSRNAYFLVGLLTLSAAATPAANVPKQPWEWTIEERLAARFDPKLVRARNEIEIAAHGSESRAFATSGMGRDEHRVPVMEYNIDGSKNSELYLPHELFDSLLAGITGSPEAQARQRAYYNRPIRKLGYDDAEFWSALESVTSSYLAVKSKTCTEPGCLVEHCRERFQALQNARKLFGSQQFDRVLYAVVAPSMQTSTATLDPNYPASLRNAEAGCQ